MEFYRHQHPGDPDWLARAALFHGHLGPWLVFGARIGVDALARLDTPGQWKIEVVCWMPQSRQRTPFSCLLDGLQASTGATMGKRNLRFAYAPEVLDQGWPVVYVVRREDHGHPPEGVVYYPSRELHALFATVNPEQLEEASRSLACEEEARLFIANPMSPEAFSRYEQILAAERAAVAEAEESDPA